MIAPHPLAGPAKLKLGTFASNADGGLALTTVPERWRASWADNLDAARIADRAGLDFILPIARWRGFGGTTRAREWSFETFTWAAALAAATERTAVFATVHVSLVHPLYAAKALATVDHISGGRAGLNIVCGWNPQEFSMFGMELDGDGYERAAEWLDIIERAYASPEPFDHDGRCYRLRDAVSRPASVQSPRPVVVNAAFSPAGRRFAASRCDYLFTTFTDLDDLRRQREELAVIAAESDSRPGLYTVCHVVCRPSQQEAEDYYRHFAVDMADVAAVDEHMASKKAFSSSREAGYQQYRQRFAGGVGSYPLVGSPGNIAEALAAISAAGVDGVALSFVNYSEELPFFCSEVLPLLRAGGLRE